MSAIVDHLTPYSMVLFNESFSSTNEREGAEIAYQIVQALVESHVRVFYVTHMYELAKRFLDERFAIFLQAERKPDGQRTFRIIKGNPVKTSYARDIYRRVFIKTTRSEAHPL